MPDNQKVNTVGIVNETGFYQGLYFNKYLKIKGNIPAQSQKKYGKRIYVIQDYSQLNEKTIPQTIDSDKG